MKAAKLYSFTDIRIEDMPVPEVGADEALMKVKASGICSGDVMPWYIEKKAPLVLGHEPAGEIVKVGAQVSSVKPGDRVFVHHHAPCMECSFCERGDYVQCSEWRRSGIIPGGVAEYVLIPEGNLKNDTLILPDNMSFEDAALIEPLACVVKSYKRSGIRQGDTVLVIGLGVMGMMHVLLAKHYGAGQVIGADMVDFRLAKAKELGADRVINVSKEPLKEKVLSYTAGKGADIVVAGPNSISAMESGIHCAAPGGTVVLFTPAKPGEKLTLDPNHLYFRDINLATSYSCGPDDTKQSLSLIQKQRVTAQKLVTHRFSIEETADAYNTVAQAGPSIKVLIVMESD
jgi:L-iditol 2-dehydrogenase